MAYAVKIFNKDGKEVFKGIDMDYVAILKDGGEKSLSHFWPFKDDTMIRVATKFLLYNKKEDKFIYAEMNKVDGINIIERRDLKDEYKVMPFMTI